MANTYTGLANTPCSIIRSATNAAPADPAFQLRVGVKDCPLPTGWTVGSGIPDNPVFFDKLKQAARRLTGAKSDSELSGVVLDREFLEAQAENLLAKANLANNFPDGQLLEFPFVESFTFLFQGTIAQFLSFEGVTFEDTGGASAPRFADFTVIMDNSVNPASIIAVLKIFHSLTT